MLEGGLCLLGWKRRTGVGAVLPGLSTWEQRWIVIAGPTLAYYRLGEEDAEPRGSIDFYSEKAEIQVSSRPSADAPSPHEILIMIQTNHKPTTPDKKKKKPATQQWKFCFDSQTDLMQFLTTVHKIQDAAGQYEQKDPRRFEHGFFAGDHLYRWQMIFVPPVIYPIQIHAIVLSAGRNCVVLADFGLTGYGRKEGSEFNHAGERNHKFEDRLLAAFKKLRPTQGQRLNIVTLTEPREIRKWTKANYDESFTDTPSSVKKIEAVSKFVSKSGKFVSSSISKARKAAVRARTMSKDQDVSETDDSAVDKEQADNDLDTNETETGSLYQSVLRFVKQEAPEIDERETAGQSALDFVKWQDSAETAERETGSLYECVLSFLKQDAIEIEVQEETGSLYESVLRFVLQGANEPSALHGASEVPHASAPRRSSRQAEAPLELPRADPVAIVLARTNFLLENEDLIPPYHVFFSNSECIAVWCKTGRWSTLQTAVWCATNSIGAAKSATLTTMGVAAAHALLAPVVAVGGLIWVGAPMVILQKSREKWQKYTERMTDLFWAWAPPSVFVVAIEKWSRMCSSEDEYEHAIETRSAAIKGDAANKTVE